MAEETGLCAPMAPDCFSISSSVSLKTAKKVREGVIIWVFFFSFFFAHTQTWSSGVDAVEKKLSCVQNRGGQQLMAAHASLKTLRIRHHWSG